MGRLNGAPRRKSLFSIFFRMALAAHFHFHFALFHCFFFLCHRRRHRRRSHFGAQLSCEYTCNFTTNTRQVLHDETKKICFFHSPFALLRHCRTCRPSHAVVLFNCHHLACESRLFDNGKYCHCGDEQKRSEAMANNCEMYTRTESVSR